MPALVLSERAVADLSPLRELPGGAARDFCAQGLDALEGRGDAGAREAGWSRAAAALGLPADAVAGAVMALTELLLAAARAGAGEADVGAALAEAGLTEPPRRAIAEVSRRRVCAHDPLLLLFSRAQSNLTGMLPSPPTPQFYAGAARSLRALVCGGADAGDAPQLRGLDWRLHVTVASRFAHDAMEPGYLLRLDTVQPGGGGGGGGDGGAASSLHATADYATLARVSEALDEAAAELKTAHAKRVLRYIR